MHLPGLEHRIQSQSLTRIHDLSRQRVLHRALGAHASALGAGPRGVEVERVDALVGFVAGGVGWGGGRVVLGAELGRQLLGDGGGREEGGVEGGLGGGGCEGGVGGLEGGGEEFGGVLFGGIGVAGGELFDAGVLGHFLGGRGRWLGICLMVLVVGVRLGGRWSRVRVRGYLVLKTKR